MSIPVAMVIFGGLMFVVMSILALREKFAKLEDRVREPETRERQSPMAQRSAD